MEWNRETILHFISLIKQRPSIWNSQSPDYKIKRKRHSALEEVALLMGVSPKEVNTKWIILRNQYSRERRKILETDGETPYLSKWYAYKDMDTLMAWNKRPIRNFWNQETQSDCEEESSNSPPPPVPNHNRPSSSAQPQSQPIDSVTQGTLTLFTQAIKMLKSIREKNEGMTDELTNYGLYIAAHLRKFSPPLQSRAKYEINKILYAMDLESMAEYSVAIPAVVEEHDDMSGAKECKFDPLHSQKETS